MQWTQYSQGLWGYKRKYPLSRNIPGLVIEKECKTWKTFRKPISRESLYCTFVKKSQEKMSTSLNIRETQIESTTRCHLTPVRRATVQNATNIKSCRGCDEKGTLFCRCWKYKLGTATIEDGMQAP